MRVHDTKAHSVCPWWIGWLLASPLRKLWYDPRKILGPHVRAGMTMLEPGPGMGFFTLELARLAGPAGKVVAVDIQPRMLEGLRQRAARAGLAPRIETRMALPGSLSVGDLAGKVDFVLAFAMVHEMPDQALFFREAAAALKPGGRLLLSEPRSMVGNDGFPRELALAEAAGFRTELQPAIPGNLSALLQKG